MSKKPVSDDDLEKDEGPSCIYNDGVTCGRWMTPKQEKHYCPQCGWNPGEESIRKKRVNYLVQKGKYHPCLYNDRVDHAYIVQKGLEMYEKYGDAGAEDV